MRPTRTLIAFLLSVTLAGTALPATAQGTARARLLHRINHVRAVHGLPAVRAAHQLRAAAMRHSYDMMARDYFAHTSPTGSTLSHRIERSGFVNGYSWLAGETLAWGWGTQKGARATVRAWMRSSEHRGILLSSTYRWIGISRTCGQFKRHPNACVWTADWVKRSR